MNTILNPFPKRNESKMEQYKKWKREAADAVARGHCAPPQPRFATQRPSQSTLMETLVDIVTPPAANKNGIEEFNGDSFADGRSVHRKS